MLDLLTLLRLARPLAALGEPEALRLAATYTADALSCHRIDGLAAPAGGAALAAVTAQLLALPLCLVADEAHAPLPPGARYAVLDACPAGLLSLHAAGLLLRGRGDRPAVYFALVFDGRGDPAPLRGPLRYLFHASQLAGQRPPPDHRRLSPE